MLNLSDKDLDRLSKEAAQEYEPGEILGSNSWEKLELRLDSDLGHLSPNPLRHIRRFPFYYAPALLVLLGISYYYLTKHPPSSQHLAKNSFTNKIPTNTVNSTPATPSSANPEPAGPAASGSATSGPAPASSGAAGSTASGSASPGSAAAVSANAGSTTPASRSSGPAASASGASGSSNSASAADHIGSLSAGKSLSGAAANRASASRSSINNVRSSGNNLSNTRHPSGNDRSHNLPASDRSRSSHHHASSGNPLFFNAPLGDPSLSNAAGQNAQSAHLTQPTTSALPSHELTRTSIGGLSATKTPADVSDSALRAFTLKSMPPPPIKRALYISRNWQFGLMAAPDFASVNALAGDKPGSSVGITVDYQFVPRWYISSGLLIDRRNYAARSQDFHPPPSFYQGYNIDPHNVDFVKGSLQMLEIPLNLRYDFSVTGNTLFFASAGASSYLFSSENGNCYVNWFGRETPKGFKNSEPGNYLFASMNLSLGVETGLSNSMSLLIAPWLKMPLNTIGLGQLQMNSVGITFAVKWAPVTSRRRR